MCGGFVLWPGGAMAIFIGTSTALRAPLGRPGCGPIMEPQGWRR